jgi:serine/threonine protein kinase
MLRSKINSHTSSNSFNKKNIFAVNEKKDDKVLTKIGNEYFMDIKKMKELIENTPYAEKFELIESIKEGSAGTVYKTKLKDSKINKFFASKFLITEKNREKREIKEKSELNRKHLEISIHGKLIHKNIPKIFGYYKIHDSSCILMEYDMYGDLENFKRKIIKRAALSESLICYIGAQILEAISYLHKNKIIHMDIKQQNILIDDFLSVKLTDFSISINYKNLKTISLPLMGTCYYISPETLEERTINTEDASKIDIYSFGVLLYFLAFCDYPYELRNVDTKNYEGILKNIKEKDLIFPEKTGHSDMFKDFLGKCLEKNLSKRYNIFDAMNHPWIKGFHFLQDEKERIYNAGKFLTNLLVDNILEYNKYIKEFKEEDE